MGNGITGYGHGNNLGGMAKNPNAVRSSSGVTGSSGTSASSGVTGSSGTSASSGVSGSSSASGTLLPYDAETDTFDAGIDFSVEVNGDTVGDGYANTSWAGKGVRGEDGAWNTDFDTMSWADNK